MVIGRTVDVKAARAYILHDEASAVGPVREAAQHHQPVRVRDLLSADTALRGVRTALTRTSLLQRLGDSTWEVGDIPYEGRYTQRARAPMRLRRSRIHSVAVDV